MPKQHKRPSRRTPIRREGRQEFVTRVLVDEINRLEPEDDHKAVVTTAKRAAIIADLVKLGGNPAEVEANVDAILTTPKQPIIKVWPRTMHRAGAAEFITRPEQMIHPTHRDHR
jgi:uncharacterized linocin/CFP29 family protein